MPAETANAEEREAMPLRWVEVVKGPIVELKAALTLIHGIGNPCQFHHRRSQLVTPVAPIATPALPTQR